MGEDGVRGVGEKEEGKKENRDRGVG